MFPDDIPNMVAPAANTGCFKGLVCDEEVKKCPLHLVANHGEAWIAGCGVIAWLLCTANLSFWLLGSDHNPTLPPFPPFPSPSLTICPSTTKITNLEATHHALILARLPVVVVILSPRYSLYYPVTSSVRLVGCLLRNSSGQYLFVRVTCPPRLLAIHLIHPANYRVAVPFSSALSLHLTLLFLASPFLAPAFSQTSPSSPEPAPLFADRQLSVCTRLSYPFHAFPDV